MLIFIIVVALLFVGLLLYSMVKIGSQSDEKMDLIMKDFMNSKSNETKANK